MSYYFVITPYFPSKQNFRGPFIYDQVIALKRISDYDVIVLKVGRQLQNRIYEYQDVEVHQIKILDLPSNILPGLLLNMNINRVMREIRRLTNNNLQDIIAIHGHDISAGLLASSIGNQLGTKSIIQYHGLDVLGYTNGRINVGLINKINKLWINHTYISHINKATWNIGVSNLTLEKLKAISSYQGQNEYVLYNGVDQNKFYPIRNLRNEEYFTIGCIGNFTKTKDQITLIKAVELIVKIYNINNIRINFIGTGITLNKCIKYVNDNNLNDFISFEEEIPHEELIFFYNKLDLFVLPSYWEAFGCVYLEAFSCGVPFIGVEGQGIDELIPNTEKEFFLIKKGDFKGLSKLIIYHKKNRIQQNILISSNINVLISDFIEAVVL